MADQRHTVRHEVSAGGVVYRRQAGVLEILLIKDRYSRWTLPKGHVEPGETSEQAAVREVREETGIEGALLEPLGNTRYRFRRSVGTIIKTVHFYLLVAVGGRLQPLASEVNDVAWFPETEALGLSHYENTRAVLARGIKRARARGEDAGHI